MLISPIQNLNIKNYNYKNKNILPNFLPVYSKNRDLPNTLGKYDLVSFAGQISDEQRKKCHWTIHGSSAACGGFSALMGEGAAVGMDTPFLWATQAIMFYSLKNLLEVDDISNLLYMSRQYVSGYYLGVGGAKKLCSWLGIGGEVASGGSATPIVTAGVRAVNSALSTSITEKMGWGYVNSYKNDRMNPKIQAIQTTLFGLELGLIDILSDTPINIDDINNPETFKEIISKIPKENMMAYGNAIKFLMNNLNLPRIGIIFSYNLVNAIMTAKGKDEETKKQIYKNAIKISLLSASVYEILNIADNQLTTKEVTDAINKFSEDIKTDPNIMSKFDDAQQKLIENLNVDNLSSREFIRQFKDREFMYNLAITSSEVTSIFTEKWRKKNFSKLKEDSSEVNTLLDEETQKTLANLSKISDEDKKKLNEDLKEIYLATQEKLRKNTLDNFAMNRIAGYDGLKVFLDAAVIDPIKNKKDNIPNIIIFYGPSGLGKTVLGRAIGEDTGSRCVEKAIDFTSEDKIYNWIQKQVNIAKENDKRHSIILINEFDDFLDKNPEYLNKFLNIADNCAKENHCTFILTTNNPLTINKEILNKADLKIAIETPRDEDILAIAKHYVNDKNITGLDYDEILKEFKENSKNGSYSNAQIEDIFFKKIPANCNQDDIINIIRNTKPIISKDIIDKFEKEKEIINGGKI